MLEDSFKVSEIRNKEIGIEFKYLAYQTGGKRSGRGVLSSKHLRKRTPHQFQIAGNMDLTK